MNDFSVTFDCEEEYITFLREESKIITGEIQDVKVNGTSVVVDNIAYINVPTKASELENDSNYLSESDSLILQCGSSSDILSLYNNAPTSEADDDEKKGGILQSLN